MSDLFSLGGKTALVTGSTRGLGLAIAEALAQHGATVALNSRRASDVDQAAETLRASGLDIRALPFDVGDPAAVSASIADLSAREGRLDILVNNAGIQHRQPLAEWQDDDFNRVIATNLTACFRLCREAARVMMAQKSGRIINIGSLGAVLARLTIHAYIAAKAGLQGLTRSLAAELGPDGINVNAIAPGYFATELNRQLTTDAEFTEWIASRTPLGRWRDPAELGGAAVYLSSDAGSFVNGHVLAVDGGMSVTL